MPSPRCEDAIECVLRFGKALLKYISPNDAGLTGGHQKGYYLPKPARVAFTPFPPTKGVNNDHPVEVIWYDGRITHSTVKWYGAKSRSEYRLTGFNRERHFPHLAPERVGSLLVLVPERIDRFFAFVLDEDEDFEDIQAALGIEIRDRWAFLDILSLPIVESEEDCLIRRFNEFAKVLVDFPPTVEFAAETLRGVLECAKSFLASPADEQLMALVDAEYRLFKVVEIKVCTPLITRLFATINEFIAVAQSVLQRRKSRAGRSLEYHVEYLLRAASLPFAIQQEVDGTRPDIIIPGKAEYIDPAWPTEKLFVVGIKTTCKDRWRQVTQEAPRIKQKHILTLQNGISAPQMIQMKGAGVTLIVPKSLHDTYPPKSRDDILSIEQFIHNVRTRLGLNY